MIKTCKKIIINVSQEKQHDVFQMYIIPTHLELALLTSAGELLCPHQGPGLLLLPEHLEMHLLFSANHEAMCVERLRI